MIDERIDNPRLIAPNDIWRSIIYMRADTVEAYKMPPLAHNEVDARSMALLREWISSKPARPARAAAAGGFSQGRQFRQSRSKSVSEDEPSAADIHYTLDGTVPTTSDPLYKQPVRLTGPTIVRATAFKSGFTRSITAQEIFIIGG